jgi:hypothetical protein
MARATQAQKAERLNLARTLLRRHRWPHVLQELIRRYSLSPRQAYRYLNQAQHLRRPVPVLDPTVAFTVKLPRPLVSELRGFAVVHNLGLGQLVGQALSAMLQRGRRRG